MIKALLLSSLVLNIGLLLGRFSGFAREAFVAATYGASAQADIMVLMLTVPDLLVNILMGGAMGAVLIPEFTRKPDQARSLLYQAMIFFGFVFLGLSSILYVLAGLLVSFLAPGFSELQASQAAIAISWVIWLIPLTVLAGVTTAYLHAQNKFAVASLGTLIMNVSIIIGLLLVFAGKGAMWLVAIFVLVGGVLRLASQLVQVKPSWYPLEALRPIRLNLPLLGRYGQAMLSGSLLLLFPVVARALASYEGEGSVALLNYSIRLVEFPLAIAVTFITTVFYPRLSESISTDKELHRHLIKYGTQITISLSLVASIILILLSTNYTDIVYGYGGMSETGIVKISSLVAIGLLSLPLQGLSVFLTSVFNARKDTRTPLIFNGIGLLFFLIASYVGIFGEGLDGLMMGLVVSYGVVCVLFIAFVSRDSFDLKTSLLEWRFIASLALASIFSFYAASWIKAIASGNWSIMVSALIAGIAALIIIAIFNNQVRKKIFNRPE